jgi:MFS family permease
LVTTTVQGSLWRHHHFRQLWIGESISQAGSQLGQLALPVLAVTVLGAGAGQMGVLTAAETLAFLVVGLPAGAWVDRWRKRRVLIGGDLVRLVAFGSIPLAWWLDALTLWQVYLVGVVGGIATVFFDVAYQSYLPSLVSADLLVDGNAKLQASESVMMVGGPAVGGLLLRVLSAPALIAVDAVSYLCSALFVARIHRDEIAPAREHRRALRVEIAEGLRFVLRHPLLSRIAACTAIANLFSTIGFALLVLYLLRTLEFDTGTVGLTFTLMAVGGLVGAVATRRLTALVGEGRIIPLSILVGDGFAFTTPLAAQVPSHWARVALVALGGAALSAGSVVYNITQVSFRQRLCPEALLGRMNASIRFLVWGVMPIGGLVGGALGGWIGIVPTLWVSAIGGVLAAAPVLFSPLVRLRVLPTELAPPEGVASSG